MLTIGELFQIVRGAMFPQRKVFLIRADSSIAGDCYAIWIASATRMSTPNNDRGYGSPQRYGADQQAIRPRATDQEIQKWISRQHGFVPESVWLLHCKELFGLAAPGTAPKENPCPPEKIAAIKQAFRRFGLL